MKMKKLLAVLVAISMVMSFATMFTVSANDSETFERTWGYDYADTGLVIDVNLGGNVALATGDRVGITFGPTAGIDEQITHGSFELALSTATLNGGAATATSVGHATNEPFPASETGYIWGVVGGGANVPAGQIRPGTHSTLRFVVAGVFECSGTIATNVCNACGPFTASNGPCANELTIDDSDFDIDEIKLSDKIALAIINSGGDLTWSVDVDDFNLVNAVNAGNTVAWESFSGSERAFAIDPILNTWEDGSTVENMDAASFRFEFLNSLAAQTNRAYLIWTDLVKDADDAAMGFEAVETAATGALERAKIVRVPAAGAITSITANIPKEMLVTTNDDGEFVFATTITVTAVTGTATGNWSKASAPSDDPDVWGATLAITGTEPNVTDCTHATWGAWTVTTAPACGVAGVETRTCAASGCNETETRAIAALEHVLGTPVVVAATCTTAGSSTATCTICGEDVVTVIDATGHNMGTPVVVAATCTTAGSSTATCTICEEEAVTEIAATGHTWGAWGAPVDGVRTRTCADCGDTQTQNVDVCDCELCDECGLCLDEDCDCDECPGACDGECDVVPPCECPDVEDCGDVCEDCETVFLCGECEICLCECPDVEECGDVCEDCEKVFECGECADCLACECDECEACEECGKCICEEDDCECEACDCDCEDCADVEVCGDECETCGKVFECGVCEICDPEVDCECDLCEECDGCLDADCECEECEPCDCSEACEDCADVEVCGEACETCEKVFECGVCEICDPEVDCECERLCENCGACVECEECDDCERRSDCTVEDPCESCEVCGFNGGRFGFGNIFGVEDAQPAIAGAVEILKWIVKLDSVLVDDDGDENLDVMAAAKILNPQADAPGISDAVEILMWIVQLESALDEFYER